MPADYFGERIATSYREKWPYLFDPEVVDPTVSFLAELAGTGAALEFGVGTGRIAIPLSRRGIRVHGIDLSAAMVAQMRTTAGSETVGATTGISPPPGWTGRSGSCTWSATRSRT